MKRNSLIFSAALLAAGFSAGFALDLPSLERFSADLPSQAVPAPLPPLRIQPQYLAQASGLSGEKLFQYLHQATEYPAPGSGKDYLNAKKFMFAVADNTGCGGSAGVTCLYSQVCSRGASEHGEDYKEQGDANGDGINDADGMNAEHSWPQGFFNKAAPMKSDLHHIFPTYIGVNGRRGSEPFGEVSSFVYATNSGSKLGPEGFEPADAAKGDIARAILYFVVRYYDRNIRDGADYRDFWTSRVGMFLDWHRQDPPTAAERARNEAIAGFQGNRNPFVDDPSLAEKVGAKVFQSH
ncbi:MAG: endonuclease [Elusimicrobiales bacterium]|nr:endonuclease [Elusimicrobiales bacterium]